MKVTRPEKDRIALNFGKREGHLFLHILQLYPVRASRAGQLTRGGGLPDQEANQLLLDEALAEQRAEHRRQLDALLADSERFGQTKAGLSVSLSLAEAEWILQILNDVRVGCWTKLGCPEQTRQRLSFGAGLLNLAHAQDFFSMEVCGLFQMQLLEALHPEG